VVRLGAGVIVLREGMPTVFPLSPPTEGSVGDGVVGLTPGPDWLFGDGALCARANPVDAEMRSAAIKALRIMR
jgi:hypothetical protein